MQMFICVNGEQKYAVVKTLRQLTKLRTTFVWVNNQPRLMGDWQEEQDIWQRMTSDYCFENCYRIGGDADDLMRSGNLAIVDYSRIRAKGLLVKYKEKFHSFVVKNFDHD